MIKLSSEEIAYMNEFERLTGAKPVDCIILSKSVNFLVPEEQMGMAIGKNGSKIKKVEKIFRKKVNVYQYSNDLNILVQKILQPLKIYKLNLNKNKINVIIDRKSKKNKSLYLDKKELLENILRRHFKQTVRVR